MTSVLNYLLEANICLIVFAGLYFLLLRNETALKFRRYFILLALVATLAMPLWHFEAPLNNTLMEISSMPTTILPELSIGDTIAAQTTGTTEGNNYLKYIYFGYWAIAILIAQLFIFQIMQIGWFIFSKKTTVEVNNGIFFVKTKGTLPTFSFFNFLFFDDSVTLSLNEKNKVIDHEMAHIKQWHSLDIVLLELAKIILWMNPMIWYLKRESQELHEYLADNQVTTHADTKQYKSLLAKMALSQAHLALGHHFNKSTTLKRIAMLNQVKKQVKSWKIAITIPLVALTLFIISCNDEVMQDIDTSMQTASQT
ncbi:MAG: M56 family metallopeptidase, partial [Fulvivirga sp.]|nr:M56 family metallopeptidase [Fulvivirga sp.]